MNLPSSVIRAIVEWAGSTPLIREVRLYGSRARRSAGPEDDVELLVQLSADAGDAARTVFLRHRAEWADALAQELLLAVQIEFAADSAEAEFKSQDGFKLLFRRGTAVT